MQKALCYWSIVLISCAITSHTLYAELPDSKTATHKYTLRVIDQNSSPIEGAVVTYHLQSASQESENRVKKATSSNGVISAYITLKPVYQTHITEYRYTSYFDYEITKAGYTPQKSTISIASNQLKEFMTKTVTLIKLKPIRTVEYTNPLEYFNPDFIESQKGAFIRSKILNIIDSLLLESYIADSSLKPQSIQLITYKNKNYLALSFIHSMPFDGTALSPHDIGAIMVEKIISKILNPLAKISRKNIFFGYKVSIESFMKTNSDSPQKIKYVFFIPLSTAQKYRNKSITTKEFIAESILFCKGKKLL